MITQEQIKNIFDYNPENGICTYKIRRSNRNQIGDIVGWINENGYLILTLEGKKHRLHRLIWLWMTGECPENDIDHKNLIRHDNSWLNLRKATRSENHANRKVYSNNQCGLKGVCFDRRKGLWKAEIRKNKKSRFLGYRDCPVAAHFLYIIAANETHGEFANF